MKRKCYWFILILLVAFLAFAKDVKAACNITLNFDYCDVLIPEPSCLMVPISCENLILPSQTVYNNLVKREDTSTDTHVESFRIECSTRDQLVDWCSLNMVTSSINCIRYGGSFFVPCPLPTPTLIPTPTPTCAPVCTPLCGQADGCGGTCLNTDGAVPSETATIVYPAGTAGNPTAVGTAVTFQWNRVFSSLADYYAIWVWDSSNIRVKNVDWIQGGLTTVSYTMNISDLSGGQTYHWAVRAINGIPCTTPSNGPWSTNGYFRLNAAPTFGSLVLKNTAGTVIGAEN